MQRIRMTVRKRAGTILRVLSLVERRGFRLAAISFGAEGPDHDRVEFLVDNPSRDVFVLARQLERLVDVVHVQVATAGQAPEVEGSQSLGRPTEF